MKRLRSKLDEFGFMDRIKTRRGQGYLLKWDLEIL